MKDKTYIADGHFVDPQNNWYIVLYNKKTKKYYFSKIEEE